MKKAFAFIAVALLLFGCASMPAPKTGQETLLAIPLDFARRPGESFFGNYILGIRNMQNEEVKRVKIRNDGSTQILVDDLSPGKYYIAGFYYWYEGAGNIDDYQREFPKDYCPFELEPGTLTVAPRGFEISLYKKNESANTIYMNIGEIKKSPADLKKRTLADLEDKNGEKLSQWEIQ